MGEPREKTPDTSASRTWTREGLEPTPDTAVRDDRMVKCFMFYSSNTYCRSKHFAHERVFSHLCLILHLNICIFELIKHAITIDYYIKPRMHYANHSCNSQRVKQCLQLAMASCL